ncbi:RNA-binding protein required for biogenesis of the ribosomal 60S subunit [Suhomyces tanzawaensis NRRL Y-17324]|uniref:RNA-binding protein required for biogenesis of the ribosomal 60S subunit n=1 Tax=Suhomyces tanzawaensis NRRL Y-17324 TaxID=984487 RepID=A0A1E4SFJ7_9ASCO|nr:RNA-binding protein required for biogenesis of the ribosomal 60S subunit [Suhomyces tanzawaensis NRRL Y-17324]ODV78256.1 RNA-binding protein required for biogenesis of the ribosomal 60S subunit [Suhomyces tanzawaensis NRRL Y-17324]
MSAIYKALQSKSSKDSSEKAKHINRQRLLVISSRGVTYRHRHMISDLLALLPHARKEPKFDSKKNLYQLNEVAELYNCNNIFFFECRKHQDLYLWLTKPPNGPTLKFHIQNLHTLDELNFTGNCLKGSRPILSFDKAFLENDHYKLMKELFTHTFGVPPNARKSKPFVDHVMTFSIVDNKIWIRNYQINETMDVKDSETNEINPDELNLVEIGPRFVLTLITILEGSFGGPKIYENKEYVSPNFARAQMKQQAAEQARSRAEAAHERKLKKRNQILNADPLSNDALFKE